MLGWVILGAWICGSVAFLYIADDAGLCDDAPILTEFAAIVWPLSLPLLGATICVFWVINKVRRTEC